MTITRARPKRECQSLEQDVISIEDCVQSRRLIHNDLYHKVTPAEVSLIRRSLLDWFDREQRTNMPWRKPAMPSGTYCGQRAYEVWVSEIMLQQTQVATVIDYYNRWMEAFPTIYDLATADLETVNKLWAGLGYYSRARRLWEGARKVVQEFDGCLPTTSKELEKHIPGVGRYTAGAVASIAYGRQTPLVDGNVIRVLSRLRAIGGDPKKTNVVELFWEIAAALVPADRPGDFNQALMELGARICTPSKPNCAACPISEQCHALAQATIQKRLNADAFWSIDNKKRKWHHDCKICPEILSPMETDDYAVTRYPLKVDKKPPRDEECAVCIIQQTSDKLNEPVYLISKRPNTGLLAGLWEFPSLELGNQATTYNERAEQVSVFLKNRYNLDLHSGKVERRDLGNVVHLFSHIRKVYHIEWIILEGAIAGTGQWMTLAELKTAAIPTGLKKAIRLLEQYQKDKANKKSKKRDTADISLFFTSQK